MAKSTSGTKKLNEALTPDQVSKVEDKYKSIYSGMLKGNKKKLMKYIDPKLKRPNPDAMAMGRAINLVKKETETETINEGLPPGYGKFLVSLQMLITDIAPNAWGNKSQIRRGDVKRIHNSLKKRYGGEYEKFNNLLKTQSGPLGDWYLQETVNENESLKLGVKYQLPTGETGYIMTGGSDDPRDWKFSGNKQPYLSVEDKLTPLENQPGKYDGAFDMGRGKGHHIDEELVNEDNSYDSFKTDASERFLNRSQVVELLPVLKNSLNKLNFSPSKQPTLSVKRYGLSSSNKGYVISMYIPTSKDDIIVELGKYPKDDKTDEVSISLYLPNEEGRLTQVAYETSTLPKGEELAEDSNVLSKVISMANQWYEKPNTIDERLATLVKEVYSEKQRKWACSQDGPEFDEMCKDTAISKKKLKETKTTNDNPPVDKLEKKVKSILKKEGGAVGLKPLVDAAKELGASKKDLMDILKKMKDVKTHKDGDIIDTSGLNENGMNKAKKNMDMYKNQNRLTELIKAALTGPVKEDKTEDKKAAEILKSMVSPIKEDKVKNFQKMYHSHIHYLLGVPRGNPFAQNELQLHNYNTDPEYKAWVDKAEAEGYKRAKNGGDKEEIEILDKMLATFKKLRDEYAIKLKKNKEDYKEAGKRDKKRNDKDDTTEEDLEDIRSMGKDLEKLEMFESSTLKEGVWGTGTVTEIKRFIIDLQELMDKYYDIVGSDDVFDGLDRAASAAVEMMNNSPENRGDLAEKKQRPDYPDIDGDGDTKEPMAKAAKDKEKNMNEELATTPIKDDIYAIGSRIYKDPYEAISLVATDQTVVVRDFARKDKKFKAAVMDYVKSKGLETSVDRDGLYIDTKPLDFKGMPLMNEKSLAESIFKKLRG